MGDHTKKLHRALSTRYTHKISVFEKRKPLRDLRALAKSRINRQAFNRYSKYHMAVRNEMQKILDARKKERNMAIRQNAQRNDPQDE